MMTDGGHALIASIYEAIGEENAVPHVMSLLSAHLRAEIAFWYVVRRGASGDAVRSPFLFDGSFAVGATTLREFREEMWRHDYALRAASVTDRTTETHELISDAELNHSDYAHWIKTSAGVDRRIGRSTDLGAGSVAGWAFHMPTGLKRSPRERAEFDVLAPHVRNLFRLTSLFDELRARREALEQVIDKQQHVVALLAPDGQVCWASEAAHRLSARNDGISCGRGQVSFARSTDKRAFEALIRDALNPPQAAAVDTAGQLIIARPYGAFPYVVEIAPAPAFFRRRIHGRAALVMTVRDPDGVVDPRPQIWLEMFGLTRMEARVGMLTMRGLPDATIAGQLGISVGTVRTHQKQLLAKTETRSKAEAAHLLTRLS
jgi:DNA-binding CsgD family transcriptional regulator